jgi:hypothetical protein
MKEWLLLKKLETLLSLKDKIADEKPFDIEEFNDEE